MGSKHLTVEPKCSSRDHVRSRRIPILQTTAESNKHSLSTQKGSSTGIRLMLKISTGIYDLPIN
ncbi:hypothetical protein J6590_090002 [Homalodisca vitripennis]|nr:hypothetical protein J6590_090002 [Homalodisca vitripennis]